MGVFNFNIPEDEQLLVVAKAHWSSYLFSWLKVITAGVILGAILTFSWPFWWENKWGRIGLVIFIIAGAFYCLLDFWKRFLTTYLVTPCRIIDITQEKILRRVITEINLEEIDEVVLRKISGLNKFFHKGNVLIKLQNKKGILVLYDLKNPEKVKDEIISLLEETESIVSQKGEECNVILKDNCTHSVPLSYSYYGDRKERAEKNGSGLVVVKKKKKSEK
ncbi:MAG: hypothetical protein V1690_04005 [Candidatus Moraniibacteriota bacterium]